MRKFVQRQNVKETNEAVMKRQRHKGSKGTKGVKLVFHRVLENRKSRFSVQGKEQGRGKENQSTTLKEELGC